VCIRLRFGEAETAVSLSLKVHLLRHELSPSANFGTGLKGAVFGRQSRRNYARNAKHATWASASVKLCRAPECRLTAERIHRRIFRGSRHLGPSRMPRSQAGRNDDQIDRACARQQRITTVSTRSNWPLASVSDRVARENPSGMPVGRKVQQSAGPPTSVSYSTRQPRLPALPTPKIFTD
jgi:hypothetical protein